MDQREEGEMARAESRLLHAEMAAWDEPQEPSRAVSTGAAVCVTAICVLVLGLIAWSFR